jgi:digeranylgeranylglycerophospholipid reductase
MEYYDVAVIGAGPAGSMAAKYASLSGASTVLIEEHASIGWPVQCAGLLGKLAISESELSPGKYAIRSMRGALVHAPGGCALSFKAKSDKAWIVDRRLFDRALALEASRNGADLRLSSSVRSIRTEEKSSILTISGAEDWQAEAKVVISAEGAKALIARRAGIEPSRKYLSGAQVEIPFRVDDLQKVEMFFGNKIAPGLFAWVIPLREDAARIGLCTQKSAYDCLKRFLNLEAVRDRILGAPFDLVVGALPMGPPKSTVAKGVIAIGDAAGQVKPTSGGGIYPGLVCAKVAGSVAAQAAEDDDISTRRLAEYDTKWRAEIGHELDIGMRINKMINNLTDDELDEVFCYLGRNSHILRIIEEQGDIDRPSKLIRKMIPHIGIDGLKLARLLRRL